MGVIRETFLVDRDDNVINPAIKELQEQTLAKLIEMDDGGSAFYATNSAVPANTLTPILTYIPTQKIKLSRFYVTGTADAMFILYIDGNPIMKVRNSITQRNLDISFVGSELMLNASSMIEIKVLHWGPGVQEYSGTILIKNRED